MNAKQYLLPWEKYRHSNGYPNGLFRYSIDDRCIAEINKHAVWRYAFIALNNMVPPNGRAKTKELAMAKCDKALIKDGYILISLERADKLRLLI